MLIYGISHPILKMQIEFKKIRDVILFPIFGPFKVEIFVISPLIVLDSLAQQSFFYLIPSIRFYGIYWVWIFWPIKDVSLEVE
jgi:hypothetical protein